MDFSIWYSAVICFKPSLAMGVLPDLETSYSLRLAWAQLREYSEMDDLRRLWGAWYEERTNLWVTDMNTETELMDGQLGSLEHSSTDVINHPEFETPAVVIESQEKGQFSVTIELDEPFDPSKLVVVGEHFRQGYGVITHVQYDEVEYYIEGSTRGQSFDVTFSLNLDPV